MNIKKIKVSCIVPIKSKSIRIKKKNFRKIGELPLYEILFKKLKKCNFDEIYIDSDSSIIKKKNREYGFKYIKRLPELSENNANGNDLLNYHSTLIDADIYFQLFITAPFISITTINSCINFIKVNKEYDSILTAKKIYSWFWYKNLPVNYNPKILPRSQDALPIIQETTGLYGICRKALKKYKCRIGKKPYFYFINDKEALDIDNLDDLKLANFYSQ